MLWMKQMSSDLCDNERVVDMKTKIIQRLILSVILMFLMCTGAGYIIADFTGMIFTYKYSLIIMGIVLVNSFLAGIFGVKSIV